MLKRILVAVPLIALFVLVLIFSGWVQAAAFTIMAVVSVYELGRALKARGSSPFLWGAYVFAAGYYAVFLLLGVGWTAALFMLCVLITLTERIFNSRRDTLDTLLSLFIFIYPLLLYAILMYAAAQPHAADNRTALFCAFAGPLMGDTLAYFTGVAIGKHKLCPALSPKKTVEGSVGGLIGGIAGGALTYFAQSWWGGATPLIPLLLMGLVCGVLGQVGDLFASAIKRWSGVKDYGWIFPGHGGVMDRLDSVLMCAPVVFCYFCLIG